MSTMPGRVSEAFVKLNPEFFGNKPKEDLPEMKKKAIKQKTKGPNKLERDFHAWLEMTGNYRNIRPQGIGIRLANGVVYWPDFSCSNSEGRTIIFETKGQRKSTGQAKIKIAAHCHPEWTFVYVERIPQKDGGGFQFQHILP